MTVAELYAFLNRKIPSSLSCDWDNDGLMCCSDPDRPLTRVLVVLDITEKIAELAVTEHYDAVVSHHPLIFRPLKSVQPDHSVAGKVIRLLSANVSAMSFHTRLDAVAGGVNDVLAQRLGLLETVPLVHGTEAIGRIGRLPSPMSAQLFAARVKEATGSPAVTLSDAGHAVSRVAVLGGSGSEELSAAIAAGADTYVTGELGYHDLIDAPERGINLLTAGHFHTEHWVCERLAEWIREADPSIAVTVKSSFALQTF